jgi:phosphatidylinositol alpha-1,6-mannosyltransferase
MKKILLVTRPICPPWDEASRNFAYYLSKNIKDFEIHILTNGILPDMPKNIIQENIYTSGHFYFFQKIKLFKFLRKNKSSFDIVHYLFTPTKLNSFLIKTFARSQAKTIQTVATLREDLYSDNDLKKILFADSIITYSDYLKRKLENLGFNNTKTIYPGIDLCLYSPAPKDFELMQKFGIKPDDFVVTYHGEYTRLGGTDKLIKSIIQYTSILKRDNIKIFLACRVKNEEDKKKKEETIQIIKEKGLEDYVIIQENHYATMEKIYNLADVVIFPVENMKGKFDVPLVVIEAMACEKPVIISDLPILKEFANEQNSVTIETGNMNQLFEKILDIKENKSKYVEIGRNARKFVEENFDIKKVAEKYEEVYKNL